MGYAIKTINYNEVNPCDERFREQVINLKLECLKCKYSNTLSYFEHNCDIFPTLGVQNNSILTSTPSDKGTVPTFSEAQPETSNIMHSSPIQETLYNGIDILNELSDSDVKCDECNYTGPLSTFPLHMCNLEAVQMSQSSVSVVSTNTNISEESSNIQNVNIEENRIIPELENSPNVTQEIVHQNNQALFKKSYPDL